MQALSAHSLCVAAIPAPWQFAGMDSGDKNGGPNNLRAWRLHRELTQQALADKVVPPTTANMIQYLESGERALSLKWLRRLADALDTSAGHLAELTPEQAEAASFFTAKLKPDQLAQLSRIAEALKTGTEDQ